MSDRTTHRNVSSSDCHGIFESNTNQTLVLLLDFKTEGLLHLVDQHLEQFRKKGCLSYWDQDHLVSRAITVVASGKAPNEIAAQTKRDIFLDAPLDHLRDTSSFTVNHTTAGGQAAQEFFLWNSSTAYYASVSFKKAIGHVGRGHLNNEQLQSLRSQIQTAHEKGLLARYWDTPAWPTSLRNYVWQVLVDEGADVLNVDDLQAAAFLDWRRVEHKLMDG